MSISIPVEPSTNGFRAVTGSPLDPRAEGDFAAAAVVDNEVELPADIAEAIARIEKLDENGLHEAVTPIMSPKQAKRLAEFNRKSQDEGLTKAEEKESDELSELYEKSILLRSTALAELHKRVVDVSKYIAS